ncbi:MAG: MFS transporter [Chloroflexi bacterium]|nr:MFS transporter [Chloroflexota bacterium]
MAELERRRWQRRILWVSWLTYASLYLGRVNIAVALPALQSAFGWTKAQAGWIGTAFFWVYALGQLINGSLGDRLNPRLFVALGLLASALANLLFGFAGGLAAMIVVWALNGYVQSTGWGPIMRVLSRWFPAQQRGKVTAIFGPCYAAGHVASWLLAGWLIDRVGWRAAFWAPAALLALSALHWGWRVRNSPAQVSGSASSAEDQPAPRLDLRALLAFVLADPRLRAAALACMAVGVVKESLSLWIPTYLMESYGFDVVQAAGYAIWLPLAGALGIALSGYLAQRFFRADEAPMATLLIGALAVAVALYRPLVGWLGTAGIPLSLGWVGMLTYGANALLLTALPLAYGRAGRVSSVAGTLDFASYLGSGLGGIITGALVDWRSWGAAFAFWTVAALLGALAIGGLWWRNRQPAG